MQTRKEKHGWLLVLQRGEEIKSAVSGWAKREGIVGAQVWGIGAVKEVELAYYEVGRKKWVNRKFPGDYELLSCIGSISEDGLHAHLSMSNADFIARGGHLVSAKIAVFGEFFVLSNGFVGRELDSALGLRGIDLKKKQ